MRRKIVSQGHDTLTVTLPAAWVRKHALKAGNELDMDVQANALILSTDKKDFTEKTIDLRGRKDDYSRWMLAALYKQGIDELSIHCESQRQVELVRRRIKECLPGYQAIEEDGTHLRVRLIQKPDESQMRPLLRRMFRITIAMGFSLLEKRRNVGRIESFEEENDLLANTLEKILVRQDGAAHFLFIIVWQLEKIADQHKHLAKYLEKRTLSKHEIVQLKAAVNYLNEFSNAYVKRDEEVLENLINKRKKLLVETYKRDMAPELRFYITNLIDKTADLAGPILAL
jgi:antitoxin component of MazEF toxin-antitoxin module